MPRRVYPISLYLRDRTVLVIGDRPEAHRRAEKLAEAGARVRQLSATDAGSLTGAFLVIADTGDADRDREAARAARAAGALAYAHDLPEESDFALPAVAGHGPLQIAVSTDGVSPSLARRLRTEFDRWLAQAGTALDELLAALAHARTLPERSERHSLLGRLVARLHLRGSIEIDNLE